MKIAHLTILLQTLVLSGCYTEIHAPGATGKIVDAESGQPVQGAHITRPFIERGFHGGTLIYEELPSATALSAKTGYFNLNPAKEPKIAFMHLRNPESLSGTFVVTADGYATNEVDGIATRRTLWRVDLGTVILRRP
jgi:hypothetical protein